MSATSPEQGRGKEFVFLLAALPFYLNDFYNIGCDNFVHWLIVDYTVVKLLPVCVLGWGLHRKLISWHDLGLKKISWGRFVLWTVLMLAPGLAIDTWGWPFFKGILPDTSMTSIPFDGSSPLYALDCWFGLAMVGLMEETIFRGLSWTVLRRRYASLPAVFVLSALMFGLIHWSQGLHAIVNTGIIGALFLVCMWRTGSVWPLVTAHFIINFVSFCPCLLT